MTILEIIYLSITVGSLLFSCFLYFRDPQTKLERTEAVNDEITKGKANVLSRELELRTEENNRRFSEMSLKLDKALELALNHTHEVAIQVGTLTTIVNSLNIEFRTSLTEIKTVLQERLPKKMV